MKLLWFVSDFYPLRVPEEFRQWDSLLVLLATSADVNIINLWRGWQFCPHCAFLIGTVSIVQRFSSSVGPPAEGFHKTPWSLEWVEVVITTQLWFHVHNLELGFNCISPSFDVVGSSTTLQGFPDPGKVPFAPIKIFKIFRMDLPLEWKFHMTL